MIIASCQASNILATGREQVHQYQKIKQNEGRNEGTIGAQRQRMKGTIGAQRQRMKGTIGAQRQRMKGTIRIRRYNKWTIRSWKPHNKGQLYYMF